MPDKETVGRNGGWIVIAVLFVAGLAACGKAPAPEIPAVVMKPVPGEISGGSIQDNLVVTVVDRRTGKPLPGSRVFVHRGDPMVLAAKAVTDADGVADFSGQGIRGPVTVTAVSEVRVAYDPLTVDRVNAATLVLPLQLRKKPGKTQISLDVRNVRESDRSIRFFRNSHPFRAVSLNTDAEGGDSRRVKRTVFQGPLALSALVYGADDALSGCGVLVRPAGAPARATPVPFPVHRLDPGDIRLVTGTVHLPENMAALPEEIDVFPKITGMAGAEGGICGPVVTGSVSVDDNGAYRAKLVHVPGMDRFYLAFHVTRGDSRTARSATAFLRGGFAEFPVVRDIAFPLIPAGLSLEKKARETYPVFRWDAAPGNLRRCTVSAPDFNYEWEIYQEGNENPPILKLPPLEPGSPGTPVPGRRYRFRVETITIPGFRFDQWSFGDPMLRAEFRSTSVPLGFQMDSSIGNTPEPSQEN